MEIPKLKLTLKLSGNSSGKATPQPAVSKSSVKKEPSSLPALSLSSSLPLPSSLSKSGARKPSARSLLNDGFRPRRWLLQPVDIHTITGHRFTVPGWCREQREDRLEKGRAKPAADALPPTFVCPLDGCHKIFDTRLKWRRHQYSHKKTKMARMKASGSGGSGSGGGGAAA